VCDGRLPKTRCSFADVEVVSENWSCGNGVRTTPGRGLKRSRGLLPEVGAGEVDKTVMLGGTGSTIRLTTASTRTGPSCASASVMPLSTSPGDSSLMPRIPTASPMAAKFGFLKLVPVSRNPDDF
jgi:hypothetical protein